MDEKQEKLLSVIVPMYNAQAFIQKCLDSLVIPKKLRTYLEVVIVDDGSTDCSTEYAKAYVQKYPDCYRILQKQNGGHGSAVNIGVAYCTGRYFKVLDADDWVNTDSLARILVMLKGIDAQVVACGYDRYEAQSGKVIHVGEKEVPPGRQVCYLNMQQLVDEWGRYRQLFCLHGILYQTEFYRSLSYQLPEGVFYDDAFFFTVPCSHAERICVCSWQLYIYRVGDRKQSTSAQNREKRIGQMESVIRAILKTKERNVSKSSAGREYWYRKLVSVVTDYYVTAFLRCHGRKTGRKIGRLFAAEMKQTEPELYRRTFGRYCLLYGMSLFDFRERDFEKIIAVRERWKQR